MLPAANRIVSSGISKSFRLSSSVTLRPHNALRVFGSVRRTDKAAKVEKVVISDKAERNVRSKKAESPTKTKVPLSQEQNSVVEIAKSGSSIFISGPGGTGKSFLLKHLVKELEAIHGAGVHITASTGIAACNIEGITVHAFSGLGNGESEAREAVMSVAKNRHAKKRWQEAKVLIIDEVSMLSAEMFEKIDYTARRIRGVNKPFGGLQVIFCGDFFQLPPVCVPNKTRKFCFESPLWKDTVEHSIELNEIFRQNDPEFRNILNEFRWGRVSQRDVKRLKTCLGKTSDPSGIKPTQLYPHNSAVLTENLVYLKQLTGPSIYYPAKDFGESAYMRWMRSSSGVPEMLELKKDTQVVLLKNLDVSRGLVNGARGVVVGFSEEKSQEESLPIVKFACGVEKKIKREIWKVSVNGKSVPVRQQVPLAYGWAMSIHKSQGMTLDQVAIDLANVFEYGQAYVGLSRATSMSGLHLNNFSESVIKAHPKVVHFYQNLKALHLQHEQQLHRVNPGDRDVSTDAVHDQCAKQKPQPAPGEAGSSAFTKL
eukprot:TRINITY_DN1799_c0_g1_i3.p1 TRINITY_DN1799_c0_g1~~TRINITY_DN1799_c0_g1_i3.p1  ORF type:complete len:540 (-),score=117.00 TRINITY_DN1799_c0_g1_i3:2-1621(-)